MEPDCDILIIGGGLNGATLALALAHSGLSSTLIDSQPVSRRKKADFDGRAYALALASVRLLRNIGIWENVSAHSQPMLEIKASDGRAGEGAAPFFLHFNHAETEEGALGHMLEDRYLRRALLDAMTDQPLITQINRALVVSQQIERTGVMVTLENGKTLRGRMLVGADGRTSGTAVRAGIKRSGWGYGQSALVCAIAHETPHHGIAHQFFMPPGPLAILPLPGNRCSIVWSETQTSAEAIQALPDAEYLNILRPRFGDFLGEISLAGKRFSYPLDLSIAKQFVGKRLALVGDAAHGIHPIAGQGLNAGLRDVAALAQVLTHAAQRGEDFACAAVLNRYQQWRRFDTTTLAMATDLTNKLFSNDNPVLRLGRDLGMGMVNALAPLRRGFIREATGLSGELPELMRR